MAGKSALPLLIAAGMGAVLLSKKKPASKKKGAAKGNVIDSGKVERTSIPKPGESPLAYEWRVRKGDNVYLAEVGLPDSIRNPVVKMWKSIGEADTVEDAKDMALAWIDQQPGYEQEAEVVDSGAQVSEFGSFQWRVITDPQRGYVGQYKIGSGPWFSAVESIEYTEQVKLGIWDAAIRDLKNLEKDFESL